MKNLWNENPQSSYNAEVFRDIFTHEWMQWMKSETVPNYKNGFTSVWRSHVDLNMPISKNIFLKHFKNLDNHIKNLQTHWSQVYTSHQSGNTHKDHRKITIKWKHTKSHRKHSKRQNFNTPQHHIQAQQLKTHQITHKMSLKQTGSFTQGYTRSQGATPWRKCTRINLRKYRRRSSSFKSAEALTRMHRDTAATMGKPRMGNTQIHRIRSLAAPEWETTEKNTKETHKTHIK